MQKVKTAAFAKLRVAPSEPASRVHGILVLGWSAEAYRHEDSNKPGSPKAGLFLRREDR